ncbi:PREDICTED: signal recognition particle receptor subunit alpha homolog [Rhagoletis zephyria]|uniref:signal recognition particle receptor subunit alpha homolog n=1 Tax=Rhagoletis zephyria TaxID=28612 RepID=UPI000811851E|nr:PREDICTED: signal recognition particle receptor subunit alpha homolog [Rhagoletis zephyria]
MTCQGSEYNSSTMLDYVVVFTKGGIVLWDYNSAERSYTSCINNLIRSVILEERNADSKYFEEDNLAIQFKLDNELDLVYAVIFQKIIKLNYLDTLLFEMQQDFKRKFAEVLTSVRKLYSTYDFNEEFQNTLTTVEKSAKKVSRAPKQMRSYNESTKSKKNVASMYDENSKNESAKKVIQEIYKQPEISLTNENIIFENRKKLMEKMTAKKSPPEPKPKTPTSEKTGKKPRVWDLGGSTKDAVILDRSKDQPQDVQYKNVQSNIVGTMQGRIRDLEVESDDDNMQIEEEKISSSNSTPKSSGILSYFKVIVGSKKLSRAELQSILEKMRDHLISKNVAADIANKLCDSVATNLEGKSLGTFDSIASLVKNSLTTSLVRILSPKRRLDIIRDALEAKSSNRPYTITFCGVNGVGKSTNLAKICFWLIENDFSVLIAACDTFRAGAVEQLRTHTRHLNALHPPERHNGRTMVQLYEKGYGKDAAGIAMEAIKFAHDTCIDIVLVDTAGRMQDNEPLMRSLSKLIKVNDPDLVLFVGEALVGNEAVDQLVKFNQSLADYSSNENPHIIDGIVLTKFDTIDDKVGAAISMTYITGQPIVFVGTGQTYSDLKALNVNAVVRALMK